jgi:alkanesulfonate monooxygenase SsuD/methylene tetrahydromethanopterin reductase-like flavin-dependent oxidoreductase (luciferase family)
MAELDFGFMLKPYEQGRSLQEIIAENERSIQALTAGFSTIWVEDHLQWEATDTLESFTTLTYLAALHPQFKLGTLVLSQSYRNPALLAKMAANVQAFSGGRVILGLGAGWKEDEYRAYGYSYPPVGTRMAQLEEAAQIIRLLWRTQPATFEGQHYQIHDAYCSPRPDPMIPLLIGGGGEQRTLSIVARYADWWNYNSVDVATYARKLSVLKQHCERVGRDISTLKLTYLATVSVSENPAQVVRHPQKHYVAGNAAGVTREIEQFHALGVSHFIFRFLDVETVERFVSTVVPNFL